MSSTRRDIDAALHQFREQERILTKLRADYATLRASRFFALHQAIGRITSRKLPTSGGQPFDQALFDRVCSSLQNRLALLPSEREPIVSIIIPVHNNVMMTLGCLQSLAETWFESLGVEIVIVDDASHDETVHLADALPGAIVLRNERNAGFIRSCNRGAERARGRYLCFLNNDTVVRPAWLDELVTTAEDDRSIGVVGAKLIYPDGRLQEAGGIIFRDGTGANYGRGGDVDDSRYNYQRDVDYVSGAALLVRAEIFRELDGFSEQFAPAYYEDADLCFAAREAGYRVVYQPRSEVIHFEGATSGTEPTSGAKRHQELNRPKFVRKWQTALSHHLPPGAASIPLGARRIRRGQTVLVVDSYVPMHDREAGSNRLFSIVKMMRDDGFHVIFLPDNYAPLQPYTRELQQLGVEVLHHVTGGPSVGEAIDEVLPILDFAWICRPHLFHKYYDTLARNKATTFLYDTIDLHFVRERRALEAIGGGDDAAWKRTFDIEIAAARKADVTITVTNEEAECLREHGISNVAVVPTIHDPKTDGPGFQERAGLLFIGNYNHPPNADAAAWLCLEIMPLVREHLAGVELTLLGSDPTAAIRALESDGVRVPGYVGDIAPYFERSRIFVAPLRFGAGHKGKVGQSLSYGLPLVMTGVAAEGFDMLPDVDYLHGTTADEIASAIVRLYRDEELWNELQRRSRAAVRPFSSVAVAPRVRSLLRGLSVAESA